jgi:hypothetical protein
MEQEMLLMNAALAFSAGYMDKANPSKAQKIRNTREDFNF